MAETPTRDPVADDDIVGVARSIGSGLKPINGLRHRRENGTSGWYLWAGETDCPTADDAFVAMHALHLRERCPEALPYLSLPPGWRFLIAPGYQDVWEDEALL